MKRIINDWYPETKALLDRLTDAGCKLLSGDNGEENFKFTGNLDDFIANLTACDESHLFVETPTRPGKPTESFLVYGNSPGELMCDYIVDDTINKVVDAHYKEWSEKTQPTKEEN